MKTLESARLRLRPFTLDDAEFVCEMLNDPDFIAHIGDRGVRQHTEAIEYLRKGPLAMYARHGVGLLAVESKEHGEVVGMCGLLRRDELDAHDVGYSILPRFRGQGFALEAASASLAFGRDELGLKRITAIVSSANAKSIRVVERLGMSFERTLTLSGDAEELLLYGVQF